MNVHVRFSAVSMLAALAWASTPVVAQSVSQPSLRDAPSADTSTAQSTSVVSRGPSMSNARVASHSISKSKPVGPPVIQNRTSNRNAVALMIVGGAALVIGAVIGDDAGTLVMLGGAGIGLYGLYMFLT